MWRASGQGGRHRTTPPPGAAAKATTARGPAARPSKSASPQTKIIILPGLKPSTFKTAISLRLSRTLKLMALAYGLMPELRERLKPGRKRLVVT